MTTTDRAWEELVRAILLKEQVICPGEPDLLPTWQVLGGTGTDVVRVVPRGTD